MALQTSGQIKFSEISTEIGRGSTDEHSLEDSSRGTYATINTQNAVADRPDTAVPHKISEWYSYDHNLSSVTESLQYWLGDGVNDTLRVSGNATSLVSTSSDFSWAGWYRIDETTGLVQQFGSFSKSTPTGSDQLFLQYSGASLNRIRFRYRHGGSFHQTQIPLHANNAITGTGSSSNNYWTASNRGNANSEGFVHIAFTYDASNRTASSGMKVYWNGSVLGGSVSNSNVASPTHWDARSVAIGDIISSSGSNANVFKGGIDNVSMHNKVLTSTEIGLLYNSGTPMTCADAGVTSNLLGEYLLEGNANNNSGAWPNLSNNNGGTFPTY